MKIENTFLCSFTSFLKTLDVDFSFAINGKHVDKEIYLFQTCAPAVFFSDSRTNEVSAILEDRS